MIPVGELSKHGKALVLTILNCVAERIAGWKGQVGQILVGLLDKSVQLSLDLEVGPLIFKRGQFLQVKTTALSNFSFN